MNQHRIESYMHEIASLLQTYDEQGKQLAQAKATLAILDAAGKQEQAMQLANQLDDIQRVVSAIEAVIARKTKRGDIEGARRLYTDLALRMQTADKLFEAWRSIESTYELTVTLGDFTEEDRAAATAQVALAAKRYETQVALAEQLVPSVVEILTPGSLPATASQPRPALVTG
jgi:hypothetical protein